MTKKNTPDPILTLAQKAADYRTGGDHVLKAIAQVEKILADVFGEYDQFRYTHSRISFVANLATSNVGEYGPALCYVERRDDNASSRKPMPPTWADAGAGFYLHQDFRVRINNATRSEINHVATGLLGFLEALATFLVEKKLVNHTNAKKIETVASAINTALNSQGGS